MIGGNLNAHKRALILSNYFNLGGTQFLAYSVMKTLSLNGYQLDTITGKLSKFFGDYPDKIIFTKYPRLDKDGRFVSLINIKLLQREILKFNPRLYNLTFNNHPDKFLFNADINYLHGPSLFESYLDKDGNITDRLRYSVIRGIKLYNLYNNGIFLTHGKYSSDYSIKGFRRMGINVKKIHIINTPVNYDLLSDIPEKDQDLILIFGRINRLKGLDIIRNVAGKIKHRIVISGYVSESDRGYLSDFSNGLPENVSVIPNPSEQVKLDLFRRSKIYLHTSKNEHFGLTVAEAVWFGCVPVVHMSGGAWEDVVANGKFGFGYKDDTDIIDSIENAFSASRERIDNIFESRFRFTFETFSKKFGTIFLEVMENGKF